MIEGKAKASEPEDVLDYVLKRFGFSSILKNKKVLITAGPTIEYIDPIRVITNQSSGKTGVLLASELISSGAKVTLVYGPGIEKPPKGAKIIKISTSEEMFNVVKKEMNKKFDIVIMAAAISDYTPEKPSKNKIKSSRNKIKISLKKVPKTIDQIKKYQKDVFLVGFKAEANISKNNLIKLAKKKIIESNADMIIANDIGSIKYKKNPDNNEILIIDSNSVISSGWVKKEKIAKIIRKEIEKN
ncbi:phosphopantothenoylcysteine decarboxylase [Candidatus Nitrosarchaeum limnium]|uniref:DNA / pantothenate metabolism flavoprotein n=1 Tax=Candidatus Nitrosarchaeum limnium BG20 TaxID=859192 RepID=S2E7R6_9ARCH|nr:DNA / pantothenate metabolism flavoprotein [Candidatus Nitrosarchaeum limnium BG20]